LLLSVNKDEADMARNTHPKPEIESALKYVEQCGWQVDVGGSHAWGRIYCPYNDKECRGGNFCIASIWSTPKNAGNHAKQIRRVADNCTKHNNAYDDPSTEEE
jgi:hypothetical protein